MHDQISRIAEQLVDRLRSLNSVGVAFSGGVDSAVVAMAAFQALGEDSVAVTAVSPSLSEDDLQTARSVAQAIGIRHTELKTDEFSRPEYRRNESDRCFFCKDTLYSLILQNVEQLKIENIVNGANRDDLGDHRPGMKAATRHQVLSPLIELGIGKQEVRELARFWGLSVSEKPASPCLSSRIAYGLEVTEERVRRVALAERFLKTLLETQELRVRHEHGNLARIEVPMCVIPMMAESETGKRVSEHLRSLGFQYVTLDLDGFRSGSMNAGLNLVSLRTS
jgi:uncharacterized protein